jgi:hypothetical protein
MLIARDVNRGMRLLKYVGFRLGDKAIRDPAQGISFHQSNLHEMRVSSFSRARSTAEKFWRRFCSTTSSSW